MGSHPHPPYRVRGRLFDRLRAGSALCRRGRGGRRAAGDGFPFARERRLAWGVTLTPALSRQGRGGRRAAGDGFPFARERRVCVGSHPHPSPLPSRERGTACRRGWVPVCTGTTVGMGESPSPQPSPVEGEGDGVPPGMGSRLHGNGRLAWGVTLTPTLSRQGRGGRRAAGDGFPFARERRVCVAWGVTLTPRIENGAGSKPSTVKGEGDGVPPGMGSRLHGNDGWHGESPSPPVSRTGQALRQAQGRLRAGSALCRRGRGGRRAAGDGFPFARERRLAWGVTLTPSRERGTAWRRGWVPVCTGTTGVCGMGESPSPPVSSTGQALRQAQGRLRPLPSRARRGRGGRCAAGDGFPFARERRLAWGVTLTPALSRRGRGGRRAAGDGFPSPRERRVCGGSPASPQPSPVEGEGDGVAPGMGSRLHGNDGWHGESPSPQPSPVEGEGDGVPPGMGSRLHGNDGWHGESPSPQPSPVKGEGVPDPAQAPCPVSSRGQAFRRNHHGLAKAT